MGIVRRILHRLGLADLPPARATWIYPMPQQRALYFAVPKVACTTWLRILCREQDLDLDEIDPTTWFDAIPHFGPERVAEHPDWFRFGFVRNPWDRLVSCYLSKILPDPSTPMPGFVDGIQDNFHAFGVFRAGMPFAEFARAVCEIPDGRADDHFRSQHLFFAHRGTPIDNVFVQRFEDAPAAFTTVLDRLGLDVDSLPHDKKSEGRAPYIEYYADEQDLIERVRARYAVDVERFGYTFDGART